MMRFVLTLLVFVFATTHGLGGKKAFAQISEGIAGDLAGIYGLFEPEKPKIETPTPTRISTGYCCSVPEHDPEPAPQACKSECKLFMSDGATLYLASGSVRFLSEGTAPLEPPNEFLLRPPKS